MYLKKINGKIFASTLPNTFANFKRLGGQEDVLQW